MRQQEKNDDRRLTDGMTEGAVGVMNDASEVDDDRECQQHEPTDSVR